MAHLEKGSFVGEIAYLTGNPATATVVVEEPCRILAFSRTQLAKVVASDTHISGLIYQMLGRDLAMKMGQANRRHTAGPNNLAQV
jgi:CRP-like cAMP-binding protein